MAKLWREMLNFPPWWDARTSVGQPSQAALNMLLAAGRNDNVADRRVTCAYMAILRDSRYLEFLSISHTKQCSLEIACFNSIL